MAHIDTLLERNRSFAATDARAGAPAVPFVPNMQTYVLTCIDPRVDPAAVLGLALGDAIVERNVGGRVTPGVLQDLDWIGHLHRTITPDADWFSLVVVHHTDCGSALFADDDLRRGFARAGGYDEAALLALAVTEPAVTVKADVAALLDAPQVDGRVRVSGYVHDLETGLLTEAAAPRSRDGR